MKMPKLTYFAPALALALHCFIPGASAQDNPPPPPPPGADGGGAAGAPSADRMAQFRQRMADRMKTALKVNDEEWSVLQPLIEKVFNKQREAFAGGRGGFGRRGGDQGGTATQGAKSPQDRGSTPEADALKTALDSESTPANDIKAKMEALRAARKKATTELETAREDLRKVLTQRQEATLLLMGLLQ